MLGAVVWTPCTLAALNFWAAVPGSVGPMNGNRGGGALVSGDLVGARATTHRRWYLGIPCWAWFPLPSSLS